MTDIKEYTLQQFGTRPPKEALDSKLQSMRAGDNATDAIISCLKVLADDMAILAYQITLYLAAKEENESDDVKDTSSISL